MHIISNNATLFLATLSYSQHKTNKKTNKKSEKKSVISSLSKQNVFNVNKYS